MHARYTMLLLLSHKLQHALEKRGHPQQKLAAFFGTGPNIPFHRRWSPSSGAPEILLTIPATKGANGLTDRKQFGTSTDVLLLQPFSSNDRLSTSMSFIRKLNSIPRNDNCEINQLNLQTKDRDLSKWQTIVSLVLTSINLSDQSWPSFVGGHDRDLRHGRAITESIHHELHCLDHTRPPKHPTISLLKLHHFAVCPPL